MALFRMTATKMSGRKERVDDVIARRRLRDVDSQKDFTVWIGRPRKMGADWECLFHIGLSPNDGVEAGHGVDAFQALIHALEGIRIRLEQRGRVFSWRGGESNDAGFPRYAPMFYGWQFTATINKPIDREVLRFAKNAEKRHRSSKKGPAGQGSVKDQVRCVR